MGDGLTSEVPADDRWSRVAVPILQYLADHEADPSFIYLNVGTVAEEIGVTPEEAFVEVRRLLGGGYLSGEISRYMGPIEATNVQHVALEGPGAQVVGVWPSDEISEALLQIVDRLIAESPAGVERDRLQRFRESAGEVGKGTLAGVLAALIQAAPHLLH